MHLVFVDDSRQRSPSREGFKGGLVAAGAILVDADRARSLEHALDTTCRRYGFPAGEEFKWSPNKRQWMYGNLVEQERADFFHEIVGELGNHGAMALIALEDDGRSTALGGSSHEQDITALLFERVAGRLKELRQTALLVADRPGGGRAEEDAFVAEALDHLAEGTEYVTHEEISFVITTDSRFVRLLQAADLLTSAMTAYIAGEARFAPALVAMALPLYPETLGRRAGYSIKLHPQYVFANLHHWLFGESHFWMRGSGSPMPMNGWSYFEGPNTP